MSPFQLGLLPDTTISPLILRWWLKFGVFWHAGQSTLRGGLARRRAVLSCTVCAALIAGWAAWSEDRDQETKRVQTAADDHAQTPKGQPQTGGSGNQPYVNVGSDKEKPDALDNICNPAGALAARRRQFVHVGRIHPHLAGPGAGRGAHPHHSGSQPGCVATNLFSRRLRTSPVRGARTISL